MEILVSVISLADIHKLCSWVTDTLCNTIKSSQCNPPKPVRLNRFNHIKPIATAS